MEYLILIHLFINMTILLFYLKNKEEKIRVLWKEIIVTMLIGWIILTILDDD